jgi:phosphotransferase system IIA component
VIKEGSNPIVPLNVQIPAAANSYHSYERTIDIILHIGSATVEINNDASATLIESVLKAVHNAG